MGHKWDFLTAPRVNVTVAVGVLQAGVRVMKNMEGTLKVQVERASAFNFELSNVGKHWSNTGNRLLLSWLV